MKTLIIEGFLKLVALLPLALARAVARGLAKLLVLFNNDISRITSLNLAMTQPQLDAAELKSLSRKSMASTMVNAFEMPIIWQKNDDWLERKILAVENDQLMRAALAEAKGVIVICPHIGNWEVFGRHLPSYGPTTNLYQPPKLVAVENIVRRGRERSGASLVPTNQRGMAALLKALKRGEITGILPDQVPQPNSGEFTDFFGKPAYTMTLVHKLVKKTRCKVILGYALRVKGGFKIVYQVAPEEIYSEDQLSSVKALSQMVEMAIEDDMAQYQWAYKRFKAQPEGLHDPY